MSDEISSTFDQITSMHINTYKHCVYVGYINVAEPTSTRFKTKQHDILNVLTILASCEVAPWHGVSA